MSLRSAIREHILPPAISKLVRPPRKYGPWGSYPTWEAAAAKGISYRTCFDIVDRDLEAVRRGEIEAPCFHGTHLAAILSVPDPVTVLDFGGGVGTGYWRALRTIPDRIKSWRVVDLPDVIDHAKSLPESCHLTFYGTIEDALNGERPDIVTCSSVLQCMEDSYDALEALFKLAASRVILDRLPLETNERFCLFHTVSGDRIPWRILSRDRLIRAAQGYRLLFEQRLHRHANQPDASDEYCLLYAKD